LSKSSWKYWKSSRQQPINPSSPSGTSVQGQRHLEGVLHALAHRLDNVCDQNVPGIACPRPFSSLSNEVASFPSRPQGLSGMWVMYCMFNVRTPSGLTCLNQFKSVLQLRANPWLVTPKRMPNAAIFRLSSTHTPRNILTAYSRVEVAGSRVSWVAFLLHYVFEKSCLAFPRHGSYVRVWVVSLLLIGTQISRQGVMLFCDLLYISQCDG